MKYDIDLFTYANIKYWKNDNKESKLGKLNKLWEKIFVKIFTINWYWEKICDQLMKLFTWWDK